MRNKIYYPYALGQATFRIESTGDGTGVSTLRMTASEDTTLRLTDNAKFYTDSAGTLGESSTWTITAGALQTIYLKCTSGSARLIIPQQRLITEWGNIDGVGWISGTNAAKIVSEGFPLRNLTSLRLLNNASFSGKTSELLKSIYIWGDSVYWKDLDIEISNLIYIHLQSNNIYCSYVGNVSSFLNYIYLKGNNLDIKVYDYSGNTNITNNFVLGNFLKTPMSISLLITLLQSMANRVGDLPATCTIYDYSNSPTAAEISAATPNETGTDAEQARYWINQIIANKTTTTISLMGVSIT